MLKLGKVTRWGYEDEEGKKCFDFHLNWKLFSQPIWESVAFYKDEGFRLALYIIADEFDYLNFPVVSENIKDYTFKNNKYFGPIEESIECIPYRLIVELSGVVYLEPFFVTNKRKFMYMWEADDSDMETNKSQFDSFCRLLEPTNYGSYHKRTYQAIPNKKKYQRFHREIKKTTTIISF